MLRYVYGYVCMPLTLHVVICVLVLLCVCVLRYVGH